MKSLKQIIRDAGVSLAQLVGGKIRDLKTGEVLGRGLTLSWRGKMRLIGYEGKPLIPVLETQDRVTYWQQAQGFTTHPLPDFPHVRNEERTMAVSDSLILLLTHQPPEAVAKMLAYWKPYASPDSILLAYGGTEPNFAQIAHPQKFFVDDPKLRARDQQRDPQSYTQIFQKAGAWLAERSQFSHVFFAEFDHLPLVTDFTRRMQERIAAEKADVLAFKLCRIDGTNHPHYLRAARDPEFHPYWRQLSWRADKGTVLSMLGTGSFWRREAFLAVSRHSEPFPIYLELYLPTLAHHLGYRIRDFGEQNRFVRNLGDFKSEMKKARKEGAWTIHPIKKLW